MTKSTRYLQVAVVIWAAVLLSPINSIALAQTSALDNLRVAYTEFLARKYSAASQRLDQAITDGQLSQANMARALYLRGRARQETGRTAEAIADLNAAIWFGKLPQNEQREAMAQRLKAYKRLGVAFPSAQQANQTTPTPRQPARTTTPRNTATVTSPRTSSPKWSQIVTGSVPKAKPASAAERSVATTSNGTATSGVWQTTGPAQASKDAVPNTTKPRNTWGSILEQLTSPSQSASTTPILESAQSHAEN